MVDTARGLVPLAALAVEVLLDIGKQHATRHHARLNTHCALQIAVRALLPAARRGPHRGKVALYGAAKAVLAAANLPDTEGGSSWLLHTLALRHPPAAGNQSRRS